MGWQLNHIAWAAGSSIDIYMGLGLPMCETAGLGMQPST